MDIGKLINKRRTELKLTLEDVGNAVGVSKSTVKKWEDGFISNMKRDKIAELAKVLKLNPVSLITGEEIIEKFPAKKISDDDIKFDLFNVSEVVTDEMYDEVKQFAEMVNMREQLKKM